MAKKITLVPLKDRIKILADSYEAMQTYIENRLFGFTRYDETKAKRLQKEIHERIDKQEMFNRSWIAVNIPRAYGEGSAVAKARLERIGEKPRLKKFDMAAARSKKKGMMQMSRYMTRANESIKERVDQYFREYKKAIKKVDIQNLTAIPALNKGVNEIAKASVIPVERVTKSGFTYMATPSRGEVQKEIKGLFQKTFGEFDFIQVPLKSGGVRNYKPNVYAKMVARSEMRMAQTAATKDRCKQYQNDLLQCSTHDNPCPICVAFEGQIRSISGNHAIYPPLRDEAPFHPNCEHNENPINDTAIKFETARGRYFPPVNKDLTVAGRIAELKKLKKGLPLEAKTKTKGITRKERPVIKLDDEGYKLFQEWEKTLTEKEKEAINLYTRKSYSDWNNYLRTGDLKKYDISKEDLENIEILKNLFKKAPAYEGTVYRGFSMGIYEAEPIINQFQSGNIVNLKGFTSTTLKNNESLLNVFLQKRSDYADFILEINAKSPIVIDYLSAHPEEFEALFNHNSKFIVKSIKKIETQTNQYKVILEELYEAPK